MGLRRESQVQPVNLKEYLRNREASSQSSGASLRLRRQRWVSEWPLGTWILSRLACLTKAARASSWEHRLLLERRGWRLHAGKRAGQKRQEVQHWSCFSIRGVFLGKSQASPNHPQPQLREGKQRQCPDERRWKDGGATPRVRFFLKTLQTGAATFKGMLKMEPSETLQVHLYYP